MKPEVQHIAKKQQGPQPKVNHFPKKKKKVKPVAKRELLPNIQPGT